MVEGPPDFSVVTPVLNRASMITGAIESVARAGARRVEHIIVDGGSEDGTQDIVSSFAGVNLVTAHGSGIYDAINIGLREAIGRIIVLLNSDDRIVEGAFATALKYMSVPDRIDAVRGRVRYIFDDGAGGAVRDEELEKRYPPTLRFEDAAGGHIAINALFFRRDVFERIGVFDTSLSLAADREWLLRALILGLKCREAASDFYVYRGHPGSLTYNSTKSTKDLLRRESLEISRRFLRRSRLNRELVRHLLQWHAKDTGLAAMEALARRDYVRMASELAVGYSVDKWWSARFLKLASKRAIVGVVGDRSVGDIVRMDSGPFDYRSNRTEDPEPVREA